MSLQQIPRSSLNSALLIDLGARMSFYTDTNLLLGCKKFYTWRLVFWLFPALANVNPLSWLLPKTILALISSGKKKKDLMVRWEQRQASIYLACNYVSLHVNLCLLFFTKEQLVSSPLENYFFQSVYRINSMDETRLSSS